MVLGGMGPHPLKQLAIILRRCVRSDGVHRSPN